MKQNPHIPIKNVYCMLTYAYHDLTQSDYEDIAKEDFPNAQNMFVSILSKAIGRQIKAGLYKAYSHETDNLIAVRGKVNIMGTICNRMARRQRVSCEFDELSENNIYNQILKTTSLLLLRSDQIKDSYRDTLKKEMPYFVNVDVIDPALIRWSDISFDRNNQSYRFPLEICRLIMEGMLLTTESGEYRLATFVDDKQMSWLFEKFVLNYFSQEFPQLDVSSSRIEWNVDDDFKSMLPVMDSDIMLSQKKTANDSEHETVLIIDTKYYTNSMQMQYDKYSQNSHNMYQIFTYVKNKDAGLKESDNMKNKESTKKFSHTVSGMILYAQTDELVRPNQSYKLSGNRIDVKTLDMNCDFASIERQLDKIAHEFFGARRSLM